MNMDLDKMSPVEKQAFLDIMKNPVKWAKVFIRIFDPVQKQIVPWTARWYQAEILQDKSLKKVARCGRRTGRHLPIT